MKTETLDSAESSRGLRRPVAGGTKSQSVKRGIGELTAVARWAVGGMTLAVTAASSDRIGPHPNRAGRGRRAGVRAPRYPSCGDASRCCTEARDLQEQVVALRKARGLLGRRLVVRAGGRDRA